MTTRKRLEVLQDTSSRFGDDPDALRYTNHYVRRLLAEAAYIYCKLENPGGSVILTSTGLIDADRTYEYSSQIGNPFHLDLIDLQSKMRSLSPKERQALLAWAEGLSPVEAARYLHATGPVALRKRRERGIRSITEDFNGEREVASTTGEDSGLPVGEKPQEERQAVEEGRGSQVSRHPEREKTETGLRTRVRRIS
jgi:hypothetical protein